jgi:hypothetical protein
MKTLVRVRPVATAADDVASLSRSACCDEHLGADSVSWAFRSSYQLEGKPMVAVFEHIAKQRRRRIHVVQNNVDVSIIENVAKGRAPRRNHVRQAASGRWRNLLKLVPIQIAEQLGPLRPSCAPVSSIN